MDNQPYRPIYRCTCPACRTQPHSALAGEHTAINRLLATLDEKARRQVAGLLALQHGRGGITRLATITGLSRNTIRRGLHEIQNPVPQLLGRVRRAGGGRKRLEKKANCAERT